MSYADCCKSLLPVVGYTLVVGLAETEDCIVLDRDQREFSLPILFHDTVVGLACDDGEQSRPYMEILVRA